jgi:hypothetical protein
MIDLNVQELRKLSSLAQHMTVQVHAISSGETISNCNWAVRLMFRDGQKGRIVLNRTGIERTFWPNTADFKVVLRGGP